jgi:serine phosphatase RsbU (regulator of sigma subunit)
MFGRHSLEKIVKANCGGSAEELVDAIFTAVSNHAEGVEAFDDQTIVAIKVKGSSSKK